MYSLLSRNLKRNISVLHKLRISSTFIMDDRKYNSNCTRLQGKVAIITASTEGIGYAIAKRLGEEGASIVISSRREKNVSNALASLKEYGFPVLGLTCHVSKEEDRKKLVKECSESAWDKIFEVNLKNALQITQEVVPHMQKRKGGSIVYVSSIAGFHPFQLLGAYSVSKTALLGLTKTLSQEVAADNIRVNCVAPGIIKTKFAEPLYSSKEVLEKALEPVLLGRLGMPDDISGVVAFLCSDDARYVTGENIVAAGGMPSRL
ncbi:Dehydrogenase/reductase SDR family member 4 [Armadillidium nasatum]|uniref:Dehydrogenase/reductase SDR family member 4 n=1 Tax=Armadillidium nasatum TaxID=96803 RepID=A0A5N5TE93_9CRUS|nr:Dehydrogenase/reductase SDR family member 4 [Armadillidium nasatum]